MNKFDYFIDQTNDRLSNMDSKLDKLLEFRVMLIGASVGVSLLASVAFNFLVFYIK